MRSERSVGPAVSLVATVFVAVVAGYLLHRPSPLSGQDGNEGLGQLGSHPHRAKAPTLVIYTYASTDSMSLGNLQFFLYQAVRPDDDVDYRIVVNLNPGDVFEDLSLPGLPSNAEYVQHANECYDWGTFAWALSTISDTQLRKYTYFIFINSSARGPFLHPMLAGRVHWTDVFTSLITNDTKLVGPTINCGGFCYKDPGASVKECRIQPHVQSVAVATDQVGLAVLRKAGYVLACHNDRGSAVYHGEIGSSHAIMLAGYNIASFLTRYRGIDFRQLSNKQCNGRSSPIGINSLDGVTPGAYELVFPKVKQSLVESRLSTHVEALKLSEWMVWPVETRNVTRGDIDPIQRAEDLLIATSTGLKCFDTEYYISNNPGLLPVNSTPESAFLHFINTGRYEGREHRWTCGLEVQIPQWP